MAFAQGSRHQMSYVAETVFGTTPGTPSMKTLRVKQTSLNLTKETYTSEEIRADRGIYDHRHGTRQIAGDIMVELCFGDHDDLLESALWGVWAGNVLKAGVSQNSMTVERGLTDIGDYLVYRGAVVNTLQLSIPATGIVEATFGMVGKSFASSGATLGAPAAPLGTAPFDAAGGALLEGGAAIALISGLTLNLDNGVAPNFVVGSDETPQLSVGRSNLTGTLTAFVEDTSLLAKFLNETETSLTLTLVDPDGNELEIALPRIKYSGGELPLDGEGSMTLNLPFQALHDTTANSNIVITRTPA